MVQRTLLPLLLLSTAFLVENPVHASACCGSSYGLGSRLAPAETAAGTVFIRNSLGTGSWSWDGRYRVTRTLHHELRMDLAGQLRVNKYLQLGASVPFLSTTSIGLKDSGSGSGVGDAGVAGRIDLVPPGGAQGLPGVALTLGVTLPTGRPPSSSVARMGADVTGAGQWELRPGITVERSWLNGWFIVGSGAVVLRPPILDGRGAWSQSQPRVQLTIAGGPTLRRTLAIAVGLTHERESAILVNGDPVPRGERSRTSAFSIASWELNEHWTLLAMAQSDLPVSQLGRNEPSAASVSAGIRRVWLDYD